MKEEIWAGVVAFWGAVAMFLGAFRKKKNGNGRSCADHGERISVVETKVEGVENSINRIEDTQIRMEGKLDKVLLRNGSGDHRG